MVETIKKRVMEAVEKGEEEIRTAKQGIEFAKKAGIDVSQQETELITHEQKLKEIKEAAQE